MCRLDPVRNARQRILKTFLLNFRVFSRVSRALFWSQNEDASLTQNSKPKTQNSKLQAFTCVMLGCLSQATFAQYSVQLDLTEQKAYLLYHDRSIMESPICSGRPGHPTPTGTFHITNKDLNHVSSIYGR